MKITCLIHSRKFNMGFTNIFVFPKQLESTAVADSCKLGMILKV